MTQTKVTKNELESQEAWITPSYAAGWGDYDTNTWYGVRYMKDSLGFVHMKGLIKNTSGASKAANSVMFTLPAGYRPGQTVRMVAPGASASGTVSLDIDSTGNMFVSSAAIAASDWVSFTGICFKADA